MNVMFDMAFREAPRKFFAEKGLPPIRHTIPDVIFSDRLNLHAASPSFWQAAPDWSDIHCVCGEFFMPLEVEAWAPSPALRAFLRDGPEPVLWTLGSWEHMAPERVRTLLVESARQAKMRSIIQTKTDDDERRDGELYFLPWAPHRHLASLCSAVVHHGGAGTTHMALARREACLGSAIHPRAADVGGAGQAGRRRRLAVVLESDPGRRSDRSSVVSSVLHRSTSALRTWRTRWSRRTERASRAPDSNTW